MSSLSMGGGPRRPTDNGDADRRVKDLVKELRKDPRRTVRSATQMLFISEALLFALVIRYAPAFGPAFLAIVILVVVLGEFMVEHWLDQMAESFHTESLRQKWLTFWPTSAGLLISVLEHGMGRVPLLSFLVDVSIFLTMWTGISIYCVLYFNGRFSDEDQNWSPTPPSDEDAPTKE